MNLLTDQIIRLETRSGSEITSLPDVFAALVADRVECFPALRAHQVPAWHMFLAQLGAVAMQRAGLAEPPVDADGWRCIIRDLTKVEFPDDEPWHLVVTDHTKPAFLQSPVPEGITLKNELLTPDELDMVITAKNHDLKQAVAAEAAPDDWLFALVSLQTGQGYNGSGNYGIGRMNGGSSSRVCMGLMPMSATTSAETGVRPGVRLRRDLTQLLTRRTELLERVPGLYPATGGRALTWAAPWPEGELLQLADLDVLFIEVCRRVRLGIDGTRLKGRSGTSSKRRINAEPFKGVVGDPWAPVHKTEGKSLTLGDSGSFDFAKIVDLLSPEWELPLLATLGAVEAAEAANWLLIAQAFARGNSKTGGFKERVIPLTGRVAKGLGPKRNELHDLAKHQIAEIKKVDVLLRNAIALVAAGGDRDKINEAAYSKTQLARDRLETDADRNFFPALWERFEAVEARDEARHLAARETFVRALVATARDLLKEALADPPCSSLRRPRAQARAEAAFEGQLRSEKLGFPEYFVSRKVEGEAPDAA